jgi:hypothetical protein
MIYQQGFAHTVFQGGMKPDTFRLPYFKWIQYQAGYLRGMLPKGNWC